MVRGIGEVTWLQQIIPDALAFPVAALTQLGSLWFVTLVLYVVYRRYNRSEALVTWGILMAGTACWRAIKTAYPIPRPEQPFATAADFPIILSRLYEFFVIDTGAGFPSGHAVTTAIVYLSLARILPVSTSVKRYSAAISVIALVGMTRIILGVHHAVDVVAGALLGQMVLSIAGGVIGSQPSRRVKRALVIAIALTAFNLFVVLFVGSFNVEDLILFTVTLTVAGWWQAKQADWMISIPYTQRQMSRPSIRVVLSLVILTQAIIAVFATGVTILLPSI